VAAACAILATGAARGEDQPSAAMLEPVKQLVAFMSTLRRGEHPTVFARRGLCIVENFAPFLFCGRQAALQWEAGFREHAHELSHLQATFADAHDYIRIGDRVYFSLPTTWIGLTQGRHFEEHGAWAFVLQHGTTDADPWRIVGYGWGVTAYTEEP
jgi:hypothetical protein